MFHRSVMGTRPFVKIFYFNNLLILFIFKGDEIPLEVKIVSVYSYGFVISWTPFNTTDMDHRKFLGYQAIKNKLINIYLIVILDFLQKSGPY
jgi:hypothetical protein